MNGQFLVDDETALFFVIPFSYSVIIKYYLVIRTMQRSRRDKDRQGTEI